MSNTQICVYVYTGMIVCMIGINGLLLLLFKQCRQAKLSYTGKFMAEVCFKYNDSGAVIREKFNFGQLPIMLQVGVLSFLVF